MTEQPTYEEIAEDFLLWQEHADSGGQMTEEEFDFMPMARKVRTLIEMWGEEEDDDYSPYDD